MRIIVSVVFNGIHPVRGAGLTLAKLKERGYRDKESVGFIHDIPSKEGDTSCLNYINSVDEKDNKISIDSLINTLTELGYPQNDIFKIGIIPLNQSVSVLTDEHLNRLRYLCSNYDSIVLCCIADGSTNTGVFKDYSFISSADMIVESYKDTGDTSDSSIVKGDTLKSSFIDRQSIDN